MKRLSLILFVFLLFQAPQQTRVYAIWPLPHQWTKGEQTLRVYHTVGFAFSEGALQAEGDAQQILWSARQRLTELLYNERFAGLHDESDDAQEEQDVSHVLSTIYIDFNDPGAELGPDTDESYELNVPGTGIGPLKAHLRAKTVYGVLHGLTSLSQLVFLTRKNVDPAEPAVALTIRNAPHVISDQPRFAHRGLLLDTSRHYYPLEDLLRLLDVMSWNKLNVFHWHVVDSHSWPIKSERYPELSDKGAYDSKNMVYSRQGVEIIVRYARNRGIRVIPEFDMPGHTYAIGLSHPELITCPNKQPNWREYSYEPPSGQLNPANPETYEFVTNLIDEMASWFPDTFFHAGGDEVNKHCWDSEPSIQNYLDSHHNESSHTLLEQFVTRQHNAIRAHEKVPVTWEEILITQNVPLEKDVIVQAWSGSHQVKKIVMEGHRCITGPADFWYLDCGSGGWLGNFTEGLSWCDPFKTWQKIYSYNPVADLEEDEAKLIIGGEVLLWSEQADSTNFEPLLWPRSSAAAEVLWSGPTDGEGTPRSSRHALPRLHEWRYRMVARGIRAAPLQPLWCARTGECNRSS